MKDEILITKKGTLKEWVERMRKTSMLKNPKLVRIAVTFRDENEQIETKALNHKSFNPEEYE